MISLRAILDPACVVVDLEADNKDAVIRTLVKLLADTDAIVDADLMLHDIQAREALAPTGMGFSCAIPHAHSSTAVRTGVAAARLRQPVDFGAPDGTPASLVFLMVGPTGAAGTHLKLLSKFARFLHDDTFRDEALRAPDAKALAELIYARDA